MNKKKQDLFPCQLQSIGLSCYGCCGRDWTNKKEIISDLKENTKEFNSIKFKHTLALLKFRDRLSENPDDLKSSGLCSNIVSFDKGCIACPLHPKINSLIKKKEYLYPNKKLDLRINHCDVNYECITFKIWKKFTNTEKLKFVEFIKINKYKAFEYSQGNHNGDVINKFLKSIGKTIIPKSKIKLD